MAAAAQASFMLVTMAVLLLSSGASAAAGSSKYPPLAPGLSFDLYKKSCPKAESIAKDFLRSAVGKDIGLAAALIRLHFHDCFVQGCDASVLLDSTPTDPSERTFIPNLTLRAAAFKAVNDIHDRIQKACGGGVVSCADVLAIAARDSVQLAGGPEYKVPLGRRDGLRAASQTAVFAGLPPPTSNVTDLLEVLATIGLDATDLVALSGGHTVGIAHCGSFENRLFPARDPTMGQWFYGQLKRTCPAPGGNASVVNDIRTPDAFDNKYYVDLLNREGLFTSDQDLLSNATTRPIVTAFALDQQAFFDQFVFSYVKMGQINVLTGAQQGQIRANCSVRNPTTATATDNNLHDLLQPAWSIVDDDAVVADI